MTLTEAAASLGVAASTLRQQVRNGKLRASKLGRDWHVAPKEVERYRQESLGTRSPTGREMHSLRFRHVSNRYPRRVAEAYDRDFAAAAAATDGEVAARVAEWERAQGLEPLDWNAIGRAEGRPGRPQGER